MAFTRAKATALLNKTEMGLYDDSRANALRDHSDARLTQLVSRARTARDRARDLEKRQRLASRKTSGSKSGRTGLANARTGEKAELLADILTRLDARQRDVAKAAKAKPAKVAAPKRALGKAAKATGKTTKKATKSATTKTSKPAKKATTAKKAAAPASASKTTKKTATKTAKKASARATAAATAPKAAKTPVAKNATARKSATAKSAKPAAAARPAGRSAAKTAKAKAPAEKTRKTSGRGKRGITPEQALENTRKLLEQHEAEAKASKHWETLGNEGAPVDAPGYQSPQARSKALALHEAETRQASINGSISTRDRRNQGKRDHRND